MPLANTSNNFKAGFLKTGISPFNENIFPDSEFMASYVTGRPMKDNTNAVPLDSEHSEEQMTSSAILLNYRDITPPPTST